MSYKTRLLKIAIKWTPKMPVLWLANKLLKGIAELGDFDFDLDARTAYAKTTLFGEIEPIEVWLVDFAIVSDAQSYHFIIQQATSNKPWLTNVLAHIIGKPWKIPEVPQFKAQMSLIAELLEKQQVTSD